jgi:Heat induced stress protein YflT domain
MKTVIGVFENRDNAQFAMQCLRNAGYKVKEMSIVMRSPSQQSDVEEEHMSLGRATITGITTGAIIGGLAGLLIGIGTIVIPGIGRVLIAGPLATAFGLTGAAAATVSGVAIGAIIGGILGMLMSFGFSRTNENEDETKVKEGATLVAVPVVDEQEKNVEDLLTDHEPSEIKAVNVPLEAKSSVETVTATKEQYQPMPDPTPDVPFGMKGGQREYPTDHLRKVHHVHTPAKIPFSSQPDIDIQ